MKRTHSSSAAQWKDWIRDKRAVMREFVGKSGKSYLAIWFEGGKTDEINCQLLCKECNRRKGKK